MISYSAIVFTSSTTLRVIFGISGVLNKKTFLENGRFFNNGKVYFF